MRSRAGIQTPAVQYGGKDIPAIILTRKPCTCPGLISQSRKMKQPMTERYTYLAPFLKGDRIVTEMETWSQPLLKHTQRTNIGEDVERSESLWLAAMLVKWHNQVENYMTVPSNISYVITI